MDNNMDNIVIEFGKLKGETYKNAVDNHKDYCKWIGAQTTESKVVRAFQIYILQRGLITELNDRVKNNGEKIIGK